MLSKTNRQTILLVFLFMGISAQANEAGIFYQPRTVGSESLFNPASSFFSYTLDSMQVKQSFGTHDYADNLSLVWDHMRHPDEQVQNEGGYKDFINTEIIPVDYKNLGDSKAVLPNYGLHLFGGGLVYRKNAEWLEAHDMPYPYFTAGVLAMTAEILAEPIEKPTTDDTDEIADIYIFRPLGIWLYSSDKRAQYIKDTLDPVDWPHLMLYDTQKEEVLNSGLSYVVRPRWFSNPKRRFFAYMGITNLFGLSHKMNNGDEISWGLGASTTSIKPTHLRESAGIFWDRNNSLLASLIVNGTEGLALRANIYPGVWFNTETPLGFFAGLTDDGDPAFGLQFGLPIGLGATFE